MDVVYYAACSLDGFIATPDGGVDWLAPFQGAGDDHGFAEFYAGVQALVMGSRTYEFALAHPPWMAADRPSWVFTRRDLEIAHPSVQLTSRTPVEVLAEIAARGIEHVWLMGGGELAASFREAGRIDRYEIAVVPVVLGDGIPLLARGGRLDRLELVSTQTFPSGIVLLRHRT